MNIEEIRSTIEAGFELTSEQTEYLLGLVDFLAEMAADGWGETHENVMNAAMKELDDGKH